MKLHVIRFQIAGICGDPTKFKQFTSSSQGNDWTEYEGKIGILPKFLMVVSLIVPKYPIVSREALNPWFIK